jgi:hypothetical protein
MRIVGHAHLLHRFWHRIQSFNMKVGRKKIVKQLKSLCRAVDSNFEGRSCGAGGKSRGAIGGFNPAIASLVEKHHLSFSLCLLRNNMFVA